MKWTASYRQLAQDDLADTAPLSVLYEVYPDDARVEVFAIFFWRRK
jgi:hypothetical protein